MSESLSRGVKGAADIEVAPGYKNSITFRSTPLSINPEDNEYQVAISVAASIMPRLKEETVIDLLERLEKLRRPLNPNANCKMDSPSHLCILHFLRVSDTEFVVYDYYWQAISGIDELGIKFDE